MIKASIDIGSNSCLLLIAKIENQRIAEVLYEKSIITRLGQDVKRTKQLNPARAQALLLFLKEAIEICRKYQIRPENILAVATEASRRADNAKSIYDSFKQETGLEIRIISPESEAFLAAKGVASGFNTVEKKLTIVDMGGASTELINISLERDFKIMKMISIPLGSVVCSEMLSNGQVAQIRQMVKGYASQFSDDINKKGAIGIAGTITALASAIFSPDEFKASAVEGKRIKAQQIFALATEFGKLSDHELVKKFPVISDRIDSIRGGCLLTESICEEFQLDSLNISNYGLRHGLILFSHVGEV